MFKGRWPLFIAWLLKYSSFIITGVVSLSVGWLLDRLTTKNAKLIYYTSHPQWVALPPQQGQQPLQPIGTFTLFLWNQGKAPSKEVHVGHFWLPANNVYPDIPRELNKTPGGGLAMRFPIIPPRTLISISYLYFGPSNVEQVISYIGSEDGAGKRIPVMLQRIWPKYFQTTVITVFFLGIWTLLNITLSLIELLWKAYYK